MKAWLSHSAKQLREQVDDCFPDRDRRSDGWIGDTRHAAQKSDHNPDQKSGCVRALDIDANLCKPDVSHYLANQLRLYAKQHKGRISYVIYDGKIASWVMSYKWRKYKGTNPHKSHIHVSFYPKGDLDKSFFDIPLLGGKYETNV
jgi:hypothetical protein